MIQAQTQQYPTKYRNCRRPNKNGVVTTITNQKDKDEDLVENIEKIPKMELLKMNYLNIRHGQHLPNKMPPMDLIEDGNGRAGGGNAAAGDIQRLHSKPQQQRDQQPQKSKTTTTTATTNPTAHHPERRSGGALDTSKKYLIYKKHNIFGASTNNNLETDKLKYINDFDMKSLSNGISTNNVISGGSNNNNNKKKYFLFAGGKNKTTKLETIQYYFDNKSYERYVDNKLYGVIGDGGGSSGGAAPMPNGHNTDSRGNVMLNREEKSSSLKSNKSLDDFGDKSKSWEYRNVAVMPKSDFSHEVISKPILSAALSAGGEASLKKQNCRYRKIDDSGLPSSVSTTVSGTPVSSAHQTLSRHCSMNDIARINQLFMDAKTKSETIAMATVSVSKTDLNTASSTTISATSPTSSATGTPSATNTVITNDGGKLKNLVTTTSSSSSASSTSSSSSSSANNKQQNLIKHQKYLVHKKINDRYNLNHNNFIKSGNNQNNNNNNSISSSCKNENGSTNFHTNYKIKQNFDNNNQPNPNQKNNHHIIINSNSNSNNNIKNINKTDKEKLLEQKKCVGKLNENKSLPLTAAPNVAVKSSSPPPPSKIPLRSTMKPTQPQQPTHNQQQHEGHHHLKHQQRNEAEIFEKNHKNKHLSNSCDKLSVQNTCGYKNCKFPNCPMSSASSSSSSSSGASSSGEDCCDNLQKTKSNHRKVVGATIPKSDNEKPKIVQVTPKVIKYRSTIKIDADTTKTKKEHEIDHHFSSNLKSNDKKSSFYLNEKAIPSPGNIDSKISHFNKLIDTAENEGNGPSAVAANAARQKFWNLNKNFKLKNNPQIKFDNKIDVNNKIKNEENSIKIYISSSSSSSLNDNSSDSDKDHGYYEACVKSRSGGDSTRGNSKESELIILKHSGDSKGAATVVTGSPPHSDKYENGKLGCDGALFWNNAYYDDEYDDDDMGDDDEDDECEKCSSIVPVNNTIEEKSEDVGKNYICVCGINNKV